MIVQSDANLVDKEFEKGGEYNTVRTFDLPKYDEMNFTQRLVKFLMINGK